MHRIKWRNRHQNILMAENRGDDMIHIFIMLGFNNKYLLFQEAEKFKSSRKS